MNLLSRQMLRLIQSNLQVGDESPTYILKLRKPEEFYLPPLQFTFPDGAAVSIETTHSDNFGAATSSVVVENCYGLRSPEFGPQKHFEDSEIIADFQPNPKQREFYLLFSPETWIQICLGYGNVAIPVLTGAIDSVDINSKESKLTLTIRDNMRYLIDQYIDPMIFGGRKVTYPRSDNLVVFGPDSKDLGITRDINLVLITNVKTYLNVRNGPGLNNSTCGKAYNGQKFQFIKEDKDGEGRIWYKIKFNNEDKWVSSEFADLIHTDEILKKRVSVKVNKIDNISGNHLHIRQNPGVDGTEIGELSYGDVVDYIKTEMINGVPWFQISYNSGTDLLTGWVCGLYASVDQNTALAQIKDFHDHIHVYESSSKTSTEIGKIYDGNAYTYVESLDVSGVYWHKISFKHEDGNMMEGWISDEDASYEQDSDNLAYHSIAEVVNVETHVHIRSGPSKSYPVLMEATNGSKFYYEGTIAELNKDGTPTEYNWNHIMFIDKTGKRTHGFISTRYTVISPGMKLNYANNPDPITYDPDAFIDLTPVINATANRSTCSAVVHDLTTQATYIGGRGGPISLDRQICNVITTEFNLDDPTSNQKSKYLIGETEFDYTNSYYDACMMVINQMGSVVFRCLRDGDIYLFRDRDINQSTPVDWDFYDYVELTEASLKYNIQDMRSRVFIIGKNGNGALFEHKTFSVNQCKGVNRTFAMKTPHLSTIAELKEAARSAFQQIVSNWRRMSIAVPGNPLIELGHVCRVHDMVTGSTTIYKVKEMKHNFTDAGFITQLDLEWGGHVFLEDIMLVSENFPAYTKKFRYKLNISSNKNIYLKFPTTIQKVVVRLKDPNTGVYLVNIEVKGDVIENSTLITGGGLTVNSPPTSQTVKYIKLITSGVNIRLTPTTDIATNIKKVRDSGFTMVYLEETNDWFKGVDPEDGGEVYVYKQFCNTYEQSGTTNPSIINPLGAVETFIQHIESRVGQGYVWGGEGELLTQEVLNRLENQYGYHNYHTSEFDASRWLGSYVYDCSGLILWALRKMDLLTVNQDYSAEGIYTNLCYPVKEADIKPGDLFFRQGKGGIYHVGVIVNADQVVEARGTAYGVIQRSIPKAEKYGRLKKLDGNTAYTSNLNFEDADITVPTNINPVPNKYTIISNFDTSTASQEVKDKAQTLNGNLLFFNNDCVLYNIGVRSNGGEKNELVFKWASMQTTPITNILDYEVLVY